MSTEIVERSWSYDQLLEMEATEPDFVVNELIARRGITVIAAEPKVCKSMLIIDAALAVSSGQSILDLATTSGPVVIIDMENDIRYVTSNRLKRLARARALGEGLAIHVYKPPSLKINTDEGIADIKRLCEEYNPAMLVIDPLVAVLTDSENDSVDIRNAMTGIKQVAETHDVAIVILHHKRKTQYGSYSSGDMDSVRGSGDIVGACDSLIMLEKPSGKKSDSNKRVLRHVCSRLGTEVEDIHFILEDSEDKGRLVLRRVDAPAPRSTRGGENAELLLSALTEEPQQRKDVLTALSGKLSESQVNKAFTCLKGKGLAESPAHGQWARAKSPGESV